MDEFHVKVVLFLAECVFMGMITLFFMGAWLTWSGRFDQRDKARCDAFVSEGFETETRWSKNVGCMARRTNGWERLR